MDSPRIDERYVSFENIDCFLNACLVVDCVLEVLKEEKNRNKYWEKVLPSIPQAYYDRDAKEDKSEALLYFVCSNVFYIEELFEKAEYEPGILALRRCELECC